MNLCPRCQRQHGGVICGIPPTRSRMRTPSSQPLHGKPVAAKHSATFLEGMLGKANGHLAEVMELLKALPVEAKEYTELLDREGQLNSLIKQLVNQIGARQGVK